MPTDLYNLISDKDLLDFSKNLSVVRPEYLGSSLFPDRKTEHLKAEFYYTSDPIYIPEMAMVNAWDAEATIGSRPTLDKAEFEKLLIKRKINQTERISNLKDNGVSETDALIDYILNDVARTAESVVIRAEVAKMESIQTGKLTVNENNIKLQIDYKVPSSSKFKFDWTATDHDILADLLTIYNAADDNGRRINRVITSKQIMSLIRKNKVIQQAINGTANEGVVITKSQIDALTMQEFGFTLEVYSGKYQYEKADGSMGIANFINENKMCFLSTAPDGTIGAGLWGKTPDELAPMQSWKMADIGDMSTAFVTTKQWVNPDPVATWTMASGVFVPVLPNPLSLYIANITAPGISQATEVKTIARPAKK